MFDYHYHQEMKLLFAVTIYYVCLLSYLSSLPFQPLRKLWSPDRTSSSSTTPTTVIPSTDTSSSSSSSDDTVKPIKSTTSMRINIKTKASKPLTKRTVVSSSSSSSSPRLITPTATAEMSINGNIISDSNSIVVVDEISPKTVTKDIMNYFSQNNNIVVDSKKVC